MLGRYGLGSFYAHSWALGMWETLCNFEWHEGALFLGRSPGSSGYLSRHRCLNQVSVIHGLVCHGSGSMSWRAALNDMWAGRCARHVRRKTLGQAFGVHLHSWGVTRMKAGGLGWAWRGVSGEGWKGGRSWNSLGLLMCRPRYVTCEWLLHRCRCASLSLVCGPPFSVDPRGCLPGVGPGGVGAAGGGRGGGVGVVSRPLLSSLCFVVVHTFRSLVSWYTFMKLGHLWS